MADRVIAVQRCGNGTISAVKTESGKVYNLSQAVAAIHAGEISGVKARVDNHTGYYYLCNPPGVMPQNNLLYMPTL